MTQRTNYERATEGVELCCKMRELTGTDTLAEQIQDILTQLMHTCRMITDEESKPVDFEACLRIARMNFDAEVLEDPDYD